MAIWSVVKDWPIEPQGAGTDTAGGYGYRLKHHETGEERDFAILVADPPIDVSRANLQATLRKTSTIRIRRRA